MSEENKENSTPPQGQEPTQEHTKALEHVPTITEINEWATMKHATYVKIRDIIEPFGFEVQMRLLEMVKVTCIEAKMRSFEPKHTPIPRLTTYPRLNTMTPDQIKEGLSSTIKAHPNSEELKSMFEKSLDEFENGLGDIEIAGGSRDGTEVGNVTGEDAANIIRSLLEDMKQKP